MSDYLVQQLAEIRAEIATLKDGRVTYRAALVTDADPATGTFTAALPGRQQLGGLTAPLQFLPAPGEWVNLTLQGGTPRYEPAGIAEGAVTGRELSPGAVTVEKLAFDLADYTGGTKIHYGADQPDGEDLGGVGDLWLKQLSAGPPPRYETRRWTGTAWVLLQDQGVTDALAQAVAAQTAAAAKAQVFTQATAPAWTGEPGSALWFDSSRGNRPMIWDGDGFVAHRLGNGAIEPQSLIASDVIATGTITAALFEAIMVLASTIILRPPGAQPDDPHVRIDPAQGIASMVPNPDGELVATSQFGGTGNDRLLITDPVTGNTLAAIDEAGNVSGRTLNIDADPVFRGNTLSYLLDQRPRGVVARGGVDTGFVGTTTVATSFDVEFTAEPGRAYRIYSTPLNPNPSATSTYFYTTLVVKPADEGPTTVTSTPFVAARDSAGLAGGIAPVTLQKTVTMSELYAAMGRTAPTAPTRLRIGLVYGVISGGGGVALYGSASYPIHLTIEDVGPARPFTGQLNIGGGTPPPAAIRSYQTDWAATWGANWQSNSNARRTDQSELIQGYTPYYPGGGVGIGQIGFGVGARSDGQITSNFALELAGATIQWAAIYLYSTHWHNNAGGTVLLGGHPYTSVPGTKPADWQLNGLQSTGHPKGGGKWIYLPAGWFGGLANGITRGFTVGDGASTSTEYYGRFIVDPADSRRPVVRIAYTK